MAMPMPHRMRVRLLVCTERMALSTFAISYFFSAFSSAAEHSVCHASCSVLTPDDNACVREPGQTDCMHENLLIP